MYDIDNDGKLSKGDMRKVFALVFGEAKESELTPLTGIHTKQQKVNSDALAFILDF